MSTNVHLAFLSHLPSSDDLIKLTWQRERCLADLAANQEAEEILVAALRLHWLADGELPIYNLADLLHVVKLGVEEVVLASAADTRRFVDAVLDQAMGLTQFIDEDGSYLGDETRY